MTDEPQASLPDLLVRLEFILSQPVDFTKSDPTTTLAKVRLLTAAAVYFNILAVTDFGGRGGPVRGEGMVEQAIGAAFQTYEGADPHSDPFERAAVLLRGITQGHTFNDGNKRTGVLLASYYLKQVGHPWPAQLPEREAVDLCLRVSAGQLRDVATIAAEQRRLWAASGGGQA